MYTGIQHFHSFLAYLVLAGLVVSILNALVGFGNKKDFAAKDRKLSLLGLIPTHLQFLLGIILYFLSPLGASNISGEAMGNSVARLYFLEHPLTMLIAIVLITIGYSKAKRQVGSPKGYKSIFIFYGIGFILILTRIPWMNWP
ncbi:hypothetical protein RCC89_12180 [Cytophagaceae bacterium ABcell3]|nr:hypothetical protein RCC89_12180 [Cytophagaceae bacterium ABcell3]